MERDTQGASKKYDGFTTQLLQQENINLFILLSFFFNLCAMASHEKINSFFAWLIRTFLIGIYLLRELEHKVEV